MMNPIEGFRSANREAVQKLHSLNPSLPPFLLSAARTHSLRFPTIIVRSLSLYIYIHLYIRTYSHVCVYISTPLSFVFFSIHFTKPFHSSAAVTVARTRSASPFLKVFSLSIHYLN